LLLAKQLWVKLLSNGNSTYCSRLPHCDNAIIVNGVALAGHVTVGKYAVIGGLAAIHQFIHIGDHAMISGGSLVRKDVPPFTKAAKEPLSYVE
jgi:UDP-N-acetylglucosamine acyltransferase